MSLTICYVQLGDGYSESTHELFICFLEVEESPGQKLLDVLLLELTKLGLDVADILGKGYDNGSNMKGKSQAYKLVFYN